jgi:hypothetical protein
MLAVIAAILFGVGFVLRLAGVALGKMDGLAWVLLGLVFLAAHAAYTTYPWRRP